MDLQQWLSAPREFSASRRFYAYYRHTTGSVFFSTPFWGDFVNTAVSFGKWYELPRPSARGRRLGAWEVKLGQLIPFLQTIARKNLNTVVIYDLHIFKAGVLAEIGGTFLFAGTAKTGFSNQFSMAARGLFDLPGDSAYGGESCVISGYHGLIGTPGSVIHLVPASDFGYVYRIPIEADHIAPQFVTDTERFFTFDSDAPPQMTSLQEPSDPDQVEPQPDGSTRRSTRGKVRKIL